MLVIVEGVDRVGKTTLCEKISKQTGIPIFKDEYKDGYKDFIKYKPIVVEKMIELKYQMLLQMLQFIPDLIIDRFHLTEFVYNHFSRGIYTNYFFYIDEALSKLPGSKLILVESLDIYASSEEHGGELANHEKMFRCLYSLSKIPRKAITNYKHIQDFCIFDF